MVDFVVEFTAKEDEDGGPEPWMIQTYGLSNQHIECLLNISMK